MSQKKYCGHCGNPNSYINGVPPKFCEACNKSFASAFKVPEPAAEPVRPKKKIMARKIEDTEEIEGEDDEEFYGEVIVPRKFEYEINIPKKITIANLAEGGIVDNGVSPSLPPANFE